MASFVRTQEIEHRIGADGRFALRLTSGDVELRAIDGEVARVRIEYAIRAASDAEADQALETAQFVVRAVDGELHVAEPEGSALGIGSIARLLMGGRSTVQASVRAEIPAGARLSFHGVSADAVAAGFTGEQRYRTVSGDLVLDDVTGELHVRGVSGDVSLRARAPISLDANTVSGDLSAVAPRIDALRATTVSGDVEVDGELGADADHRIETVSGDLSIGGVGALELEVRGLSSDVSISMPHRTEGSRDRRRYVIGEGGPHVLFSSMSGDAVVHPSRRGGGAPVPPRPPAPPAPLTPATPPAPRAPLDEERQLGILRALERGEIDVDEAARRLAGGVDA